MNTREQQDAAIDALLRGADRASTTRAGDDLLHRQLGAAIAHAGAPRRRRRLLIPAAITAALLGGVAATGAVPALAETVRHLAAETGVFGDGLGSHGAPSGKHYSEMDDSEWIDLSAHDFPTYAERLMPAYITLPAAVSRQRFASDIAHGLAGDGGTGRGAVMQVSGIRRFFEADAACVWYSTWQGAARDGDRALARQAAAQYDAAASWPEIVASDGGGVVASMHRVHALAAAGRWAAARAELGTDCTPADVAAVTR